MSIDWDKEEKDPTWISIHADPVKQRMSGVATHGMTPFDVPIISEIAPNLWQGGCQNGLVLPKNIKHIVSLYKWEKYLIHHSLLTNLTVEMYDSTEQGFEQVEHIASWVNFCRESGPVLVHCQAGLNRSSLVAAAALRQEGMTGQKAADLLREKRSPACLCNPAFYDYITK